MTADGARPPFRDGYPAKAPLIATECLHRCVAICTPLLPLRLCATRPEIVRGRGIRWLRSSAAGVANLASLASKPPNCLAPHNELPFDQRAMNDGRHAGMPNLVLIAMRLLRHQENSRASLAAAPIHHIILI